MAVPRAVAGDAAAANPPETTFQRFVGVGQTMFLAWAVTHYGSQFIQSKLNPPKPNAASEHAPDGTVVDPWTLTPVKALSEWDLGQNIDIHVHLSTSLTGQDIFSRQWTSAWRADPDADLPRFTWENITFGNWKDSRTVEFEVKFPDSVLNNGTLWADIYLAKGGASPDPQNPAFEPNDIHHIRAPLTTPFPKKKAIKEKNLLSGGTQGEEEEDLSAPDEPPVVVQHFYPNLTLALISDAPELSLASLPVPLVKHLHFAPKKRDPSGTAALYKPIVYPNEIWHLRSHYVELNSSTPSLPLQIDFSPISFMRFQVVASLDAGFKDAASKQGSAGASEMDEVKRMFLETNPWFLGLTALVSMLHVLQVNFFLFEMLAFKSDVSHWRTKKEMVGVSVRTIVTNVFVQTIILLYLIDNNTDTSWMILFGSGTGVLIEAWKITKAVDISIVTSAAGARFPYRLDIKDKHVLSEDEKKTQEYDKLAFRYVSWVAIPTLAAYTGYSLVYNTHKGWYSFVISTLTSFVYMFGFAQLVPQLIINYKLKSVAHMPMKAMIYKTLSTVVDDFFAFCIKMPFLHRLACFRDDVVFAIFLYQRWIYRIDPKRVNEYGQVLVEEETEKKETKKEKKNK